MKQHARKTKPLPLRRGEHCLPVLHHAKMPGPIAQADATQRRIDVVRHTHAQCHRVANGFAQRTHGHIGPVSGNEDVRARGQRHFSGAPWPKPCNGENELVADRRIAFDQHMFAGADLGRYLLHHRRRIVLHHAHAGELQRIALMLHLDAVRAEFLLELAQCILQRHHAFDGGPPQGDAGKIVDRKRQRGGDLRKGLRHLHQRAERDQPHDIARRRDKKRKRVCQHAVRRGEHDDAHQTIGLALPAPSHATQQLLKMRSLIGIAADQGDAFRIFPGTRQAKAEIGFHRLPQIGGADQREPRP